MMMIQLKIDVTSQLRSVVPSKYDLIVPSIVIKELSHLRRKAKGKDKIAASVALKMAQEEPFINEYIEKNDHVDNLLLDYCTDKDILCTNDRILRKRARERQITVIYLRQHRYLKVDGYIQ